LQDFSTPAPSFWISRPGPVRDSVYQAIRSFERQEDTRKMIRATWIFAAALAGLSLHAGSIPITNPSFETVVNASGCSSGNTMFGGEFISTVYLGSGCVNADPLNGTWTPSGDVGVWAPTTSYYPSVPDGTNVGFTNDGSLSQILGSSLGLGTYTLSLYIGSRCDSHPLTNYNVELLAGGNLIGSDSSNPTILSELACGDKTIGSFVLDTLVIPVPSSPFVGDPLEIVLSSIDNGDMGIGDDFQAAYDAVSLNYSGGSSSAPEPASWLVTAAGLALVARRRYSK
jgi:hypothetical protein